MGILEKNTVENIIILLASILLFNGLINIKVIGDYLKQYPIIVIIVALLLIIFKDKIAGSIAK